MYNKNQLKKTQEKKVLKKRKKQWVVVSAATFLLLGTSIPNFTGQSYTVSANDEGQEQGENAGSTDSLQDSSTTSDPVSDALADVQALKDNQMSGKTPSDSLNQSYIDSYNLTYKGFVDGTNDGTGTDNIIDDDVQSSSQTYQDAYAQGKTYFSNTQNRLIRTATQLRNAYLASNTRQIKIMNNISLWQLRETAGFSSTVFEGKTLTYSPQSEQIVYFNNTNLTVDGRNKVVDYSNYAFANNSVGDLTMKDITMFGGNFYGPTKNQGNGTLTYDNITYTGPQLISATGTQVFVKNQVTVNGGQNYRPRQDTGINDPKAPDYVAGEANYNATLPYAGGNQENMEVSSLTFLPGSHYTGSTFNSTALYINSGGNVEVGEGATVDLRPMGDGTWGAASSPTSSMGYGIYIPNGNVNIRKKCYF
ncbi:pectate lyase-like adhesive domain-containing protein [Holzapfeliella floricola]|uniref:pectate lyase-like adhesive domain-containing protein n=1 Tax=Holzapfeliella floricola TaxID=679249 RepID=UPI000781408B|nr:pectate lyase-like adhesive domain-containing protein [Holzapfeliella floricola]